MTQLQINHLPSRIAITGAGGQLGNRLCRVLGPRALPLDYPSFDLTRPDDTRQQLAQLRPQVLINTAAYTAVDRAEDEAERCRAINATGVDTLAQATAATNCLLVQISSDYVFGGSHHPPQPHREEDPTDPQGVYAQSKWEGERNARNNPRHLIIRSCGLYGLPGDTSSSNFVLTMLRLGRSQRLVRVVHDQRCCPTWVDELATAILWLVGARQQGLFHVVNTGPISWFQFAQEIFRQAKIECTVEPITTQEYGARAPRPHYSALDTSKYQSAGGPSMSDCRAAMAQFLQQAAAEGSP